MEVAAAVVNAARTPPTVERLRLRELHAGEVLLRIAACGVCHTDIAIADAELWPHYPIVLGHEYSGVVEAVAPDVTAVAVGDRVLYADAYCGHCRYCEGGHPVLCQSMDDSARGGRLFRGQEPILQSVAGFSEATILDQEALIPVPDDVPLDLAALVGCAVLTGTGAVFNTCRVEPGSAVAVMGCGAVGLSAVMAAVVAGASVVVAVDPRRERRESALGFGATAAADAVEAELRDLVPGGFDHVIEAVGRASAIELGIRVLRPGGDIAVLGVTPEGTTFSVDAFDLLLKQKRILGCLRGDPRPHVEYRRIFDLHRAGRLPFERLVSARIPLAQAAEAFRMARENVGIRTLVVNEEG